MSAPHYKLIISDLDGTLLDDAKNVAPRTVKALKHITEKHSVLMVLASGRASYLIEPTAVQLADATDCYLIAYNGAVGFTMNKDKRRQIFCSALPPADLGRIMDVCTSRGLALNIYLPDKVNMKDTPENRPLAELYSEMTGATYNFVESYDQLKGVTTPKCLIICKTESMCDTLMEEMTTLFPQLSVVKSNCKTPQKELYFVEFLQSGVDKGWALKQICQHLQISLDDTLAFGDAENDLSMLRTAGRSICMANGAQVCKDASHKVSQFTNNEDAVARELEEIFCVPSE
eukprot:TRINITY_DN13346_c0_g1_i2.p1 TRINITY_DN13346_c0_g1~~TRINITY_DN13346_c0_g1_i2.p1  ORF type:complete len:296 (-),score=38.17 TRINITY_DN13346_c0_g1_i2:50-913(-)